MAGAIGVLVAALWTPSPAFLPDVEAAPTVRWRLDQNNVEALSVPPAIRDAVAAELDYDDGEIVMGIAVDLNNDGRKDFLLQSAARLCGTGGCVYILVDGASQREIGRYFGSPLVVDAQRRHGYPDIAAFSRDGGDAATYTIHGFDGRAYTIVSRRRVKGAAQADLLNDLRSVPPRPRP